jgi:hypothetical protein
LVAWDDFLLFRIEQKNSAIFNIGLDDFGVPPFVYVHHGRTLRQLCQVKMLCQIPNPHRVFNLHVVVDA